MNIIGKVVERRSESPDTSSRSSWDYVAPSVRQRPWHNNFSCCWRMMVNITPSLSSSILVILASIWGCIEAESIRANFLDSILADLSNDYQQLEYG